MHKKSATPEEIERFARAVAEPELRDSLRWLRVIDEAEDLPETTALANEALVVDLMRSLGAELGVNIRVRPETVEASRVDARVLSRMGKLDEARDLQKEVLQVVSETRGAHHPETLWAIQDLINTIVQQQNWADAIPLVERGIEIATLVYGDDSLPHLDLVRTSVGIAMHEKRWQDAIRQQRELMSATARAFGDRDPRTVAEMEELVRLQSLFPFAGHHDD